MDAGGPSCKVCQGHQNSSNVKLQPVLTGNTVSLSDFPLLYVCVHELFPFPGNRPYVYAICFLIALVGSWIAKASLAQILLQAIYI